MHLSRKIFHATGIVIVLIWRIGDFEPRTVVITLWACVALLLLVDLLRWKFPAIQALFLASFSRIVDPKDHTGFNGSTLYFMGCALAASFFELDAACGGILALAVGDASAAVVGSSIKSPKWGRVSLAGSLACLVFAAGAIFTLPSFDWKQALIGGAAAALLEAVSGSKLDNLTIPCGVAFVLSLL